MNEAAEFQGRPSLSVVVVAYDSAGSLRRTLPAIVSELRSGDELIGEQFRGIRPAFGYPACPDHSEKQTLLALLDTDHEIADGAPVSVDVRGRPVECEVVKPPFVDVKTR